MADFTNSYVLSDTLLEACIGADPREAAISLKALAATSQEWYCRKATEAIDFLNYAGFEYLDQATQIWTNGNVKKFPRKYIPSESVSPWGSTLSSDAYGYVYDSASVPQAVIDACCEEAIAIYDFYSNQDNTDRENLIERGVQNYSMGGIYSETLGYSYNARNGLRSREAMAKLRPFISNFAIIE